MSGLSGRIRNVSVSFHLTHTFDADLTISLIGPDGTMIDLSVENGGSANNYGSALLAAHVQDNLRRQRGQLDHQRIAPFVGSFRPEQPLSTVQRQVRNGCQRHLEAENQRLVRRRYRNASVLVDRDQHCCRRPGRTSPGMASTTSRCIGLRPASGSCETREQCSLGFRATSPSPATTTGMGRRTARCIGRRTAPGSCTIRPRSNGGFPATSPSPAITTAMGRRTARCIGRRTASGSSTIRPRCSGALPGDIPVPGDYNGDGTTDVAVYRPATGEWWVPNQAAVVWGLAGDLPVPGDYNGDGMTDRAVFRPSTGEWWVQGQAPVQWGLHGDIPVPATTTATAPGSRRVSAVDLRLVRAQSGRSAVWAPRRSTGASARVVG